MTKFLTYDELTPIEQVQAKESYLYIRETEEHRENKDINSDYTEPIDLDGVKFCKFERTMDGYIEVII